ncbi:hypothetical protein D3C79_848420 [compost metagenome]
MQGGHAHVPRLAYQFPQDGHGVVQAQSLVIDEVQLVEAFVEHGLELAGIDQRILHGVAELIGHGDQIELHRLHLLLVLAGQMLVIETLTGGEGEGTLQFYRVIDGVIQLGHGARDIVVPKMVIVRGGGDLILDHQGDRLFQIGGRLGERVLAHEFRVSHTCKLSPV